MYKIGGLAQQSGGPGRTNVGNCVGTGCFPARSARRLERKKGENGAKTADIRGIVQLLRACSNWGGGKCTGVEACSLLPLAMVKDFKVAACDNLRFIGDLPDGSVQLIITSPPYNLGKEYEDPMDIDSYLEWQSGVIEECVRVVGSRGSICWQVGDYISRGEVFPLDTLMYHAFKSRGLQLRNRIVWHYEHGLHCTRRLSGRYETINWWSKTDDYVWHLDPIRVPSKEPGKRHY